MAGMSNDTYMNVKRAFRIFLQAAPCEVQRDRMKCEYVERMEKDYLRGKGKMILFSLKLPK